MCAPLRPRLLLPALLAWLVGCGGGHGQFQGAPGEAPVEHGGPPASEPPRRTIAPDPTPLPLDAEAGAGAEDPPQDLPPAAPAGDETAPTNLSIETARELLVDDGVGLLQQVLTDEQLDYFHFEGEAGAFYVLTTSRGPFTPNNVITLLGPDREPLAENDYGALFGGDGIDARLVVRLQRSGTHYVVVEDRTTPAEYFEADTPVLFYRLTLDRLSESGTGFAIASEDETPTEVRFSEHDATGFRYATLVGTLAPGTRDLFEFQGYDAQALIGHAIESGIFGNGSTSTGGRLEIVDAEQTVVARIDRRDGQIDIHPPVSAQSYRLSIDATDDTGDNDFYAIDLVQLPDNPAELDDAANDEPQGAEAIALDGTFRRRGLLLSHLPPGDVDHYGFEAEADERVLFSCEASSAGSGLRGLVAEVSDAEGRSLGFARETSITGLLLRDVRVPESGSYVVRLSADAIDDEVESDWARCVIIIEP